MAGLFYGPGVIGRSVSTSETFSSPPGAGERCLIEPVSPLMMVKQAFSMDFGICSKLSTVPAAITGSIISREERRVFMHEWLMQGVENYGYIDIFLFIALENVFPPIPSEVILTFSGFVTTQGYLSIPGVIAASTFGSLAGALLLYQVGRLISVDRLDQWTHTHGHWLRLRPSDIHRANAWFERWGYWTVFFCRMIPLVRSLISVPAGMSGMRRGVFLLLTLAGTLIWNTVLVFLGASIGRSWEDIVAIMDVYASMIYILFLLLLLFLLGTWIYRRWKASPP